MGVALARNHTTFGRFLLWLIGQRDPTATWTETGHLRLALPEPTNLPIVSFQSEASVIPH
jgi:hypothetical protein